MIDGACMDADDARAAVHSRTHGLLWVLLLGLLLGFAFQGTRGLWSPDEGRYVDAALQMLDSGNYLAPAYSPSELNFSKPPLTYWVIAASLNVFGRHNWAARAPCALIYLATLALLYFMGRRTSPNKPWLPALVYATSLFPFATANIISTDVLLTLVEGMAALGFIIATWSETPGQRHYGPWLMWLGFGLAFLTKGPPGLLPLLAIMVFTTLCGGGRAMARLFHPIGLAIFLVVGFTWYAVAIAQYPGLLHYFLHEEVYGRVFTAMHKRHAGAFGWAIAFLPVLVAGTLPWWRGAARSIRDMATPSLWARWRKDRSIELFLALWFSLPFLIFCLARSRLPLYLLPLFIPLALLTASQMEYSFDLGKLRTKVLLVAWVLALLAVKGTAGYAHQAKLDNRQIAEDIATSAQSANYHALMFVGEASDTYAVEEQTPWGVRLYLNKPVYGITWRNADAGTQLCAAIKTQGTTLLVVDHDIDAAALSASLNACHALAHPAGKWRNNTLLLAQG